MTTEAAQLEMRIVNGLDAIEQVIERFNVFAAGHAIPDGVRRTFDIAFDELLNNVVSYAYSDTDEHFIDVVIRIAGGQLEAVISDDGAPFDPFARSAPDTDFGVEEREIGGLGIRLVKNVMDSVAYECVADRNQVVISKRFGATS